MSSQTLIVRLDSELLRRVRRFMAGAHGYASLDELVEVALDNQLRMEQVPATTGDVPPSRFLSNLPEAAPIARSRQVADELGHLKELLERPAVACPLTPADEGPRTGTLSPFTNRLSPIKVATRVLANISVVSGAWPAASRFREESAEAARYLGMRLREADEGAPTIRRWVAYPIGADAEKAKARFINSFTMTAERPAAGPMVTLGLANLVDGKAMLTRAGWRLAAAPSPLMDGSDGTTLSPAEAEVLRAQLKQSTDEMEATRRFLRLVRQSHGKQEHLDELLGEDNGQWSKEVLTAQRSAMLGRLSDLGVLEVTGRGLTATIELLPPASSLDGSGAR